MTNKPTVHYRGQALAYYLSANLCPIDHPDQENVPSGRRACTSRVLSWDKATGRIETRNTVYIPEELETA
jgi:hypothetical protein